MVFIKPSIAIDSQVPLPAISRFPMQKRTIDVRAWFIREHAMIVITTRAFASFLFPSIDVYSFSFLFYLHAATLI